MCFSSGVCDRLQTTERHVTLETAIYAAQFLLEVRRHGAMWGFHCGSIPPSFLETGYVDSNNGEASYAGACGLQRTQLKKPSAVLVVSRACFRALSVNPSPPPLVVSCVSPLLSQLCLQVQQSGAFLRGSEAVAAVLVVSPPLLRPPQSITSAAHFVLRVSFASSNYFCRCNKAAPFSMALRQELCRI